MPRPRPPHPARAALALATAALALTACGRLIGPPVPDGEPTELSRSRTATTWTDGEGKLELHPDGTFTADHLCGDYDIAAHGPENDPKSGSGTWEGSRWKGDTQVRITFKSGAESLYEVLQDGKTLKLWTYVGDPDSGHPLCVLTRQ
ncbi:hypothetical protein ACFPM3_11505 [Streptomyces coeruleoprunus]|uniref:Lipoprotein n=1 Tax=Streptomyces coeruleoprunus TaxID=285563 RepID=A0ABV9XBC8_9ACTN